MFARPSSSGLLLVVEEWEFTDAENVNFTVGCKCEGLHVEMRARQEVFQRVFGKQS